MKLWNKLAQDRRVIIILSTMNILQFMVILGLIFCVFTIPTRFTFYVPPDLTNGAKIHPNTIPDFEVGQFTYDAWQFINNWSQDGSKDAYNNLAFYSYYFTPQFRYELRQQYAKLKELGELQGRVRVIRPIATQKIQVTKLNADTWEVILTLRESEYVNGVLIKDKEIEYPFKVVRFEGNRQLNPFGLAIAGFASNSFVIKTYK